MKKTCVFILMIMISCKDTSNKSQKVGNSGCIIDNKVLFEKIAEEILINRYGKDQILNQKPYVIEYKNDSVWTMKGTLSKHKDGGTFYIEINCKNSEILRIGHTK